MAVGPLKHGHFFVIMAVGIPNSLKKLIQRIVPGQGFGQMFVELSF